MRHSITACLLLWGWERSDAPPEDVGECIDYTGCYRGGRWEHPHKTGNYCAQHAHQAGSDGFGTHP